MQGSGVGFSGWSNSSPMAEQLGIVGSGSIACGLARTAAEHHQVLVWARSDASAARAGAKVQEAGARVVTDLAELAGCDLVVEAVAEDREVKRDVYARLAALLPEDALLGTTTSSLSVAELAEASGRADRFAALHVFNPVEKMALVELSFPPQASESTRQAFHALCDRLGKTPVEVPDAAGFVVNRLLFPYLFDAVRLLERNGIDAQSIDTCMKLGAGHPMGPLALLDFVGLDVAAAIGESIGVDVPPRLRELVAEGKLGRKSGAGFYRYD
jgi:3-hydroxybutyryl-CoA dehydrogenase